MSVFMNPQFVESQLFFVFMHGCVFVFAYFSTLPSLLLLLFPPLHLLYGVDPPGCLDVLLIRTCRVYNPVNNTLLFDGKYASPQLFKALGCDDLVSAVFEMAKTLSRLQLSEEEMALFSATVLLSPDRPWLTDSQKVRKLQEKVYVALQHCLHKGGAPEEKLTKMVSKLPMMKSICNLHIDKLEFFRLLHPETAYNFPALYREVFCSEITFPDSTEG